MMRKLFFLIPLFFAAACAPQATPTPAATTEAAVFEVTIAGAWARPAMLMEATEEAGEMAGHDMSGMMEATEEAGEMAGHDMSGMMEATEEASMHGMMSGAVSAAYMQITNNGAADVRLVSASTTVAALTQIHETTIENDVARMSELANGLVIPAGETVELRPGGIHVMMMNLQSSLIEGETVTVTLTFDTGDIVAVEAVIQMEAPTGN
jgi:hypothetical protein